MITSEVIKKRLWDGATELRGSMDASRYKDYMLGLMFYKFLSDNTLDYYKKISGLHDVTEEELIKHYAKQRAESPDRLDATFHKLLGYFVLPEYLYQSWLMDIKAGTFEVQNVSDSFANFERIISAYDKEDDFKGLFSSSTLDLTDTALGSNLNERNKNIKALIELFADLNMVALQKGDVLGDAYEYLIGQFAMESGKKAGEFYTPRQVSEVMAQIIAKSSDIKTIYDPTVGSGSLLLTVNKHLSPDDQELLHYYGQEKNTSTYNLTRMNLLLHGVRPEKMKMKNGDTLAEDWPEDPDRPSEGILFDAVVMNPPYSVKNWNKHNLKPNDPRFEVAGVLPPDSKGDYAFLLHGLYHLDTNGTMAIVLPHGVLFRGGTEGEIRKRLLEKNFIDTVIGLPSNLFTNTGIPVSVLILKKNRKMNDPVLTIDASKDFVKVGKQNVLLEKDIAKIVDTYSNNTEILGYSHLANRQEIIENEFNLNIPRYVEAIDTEISHDVDGHILGGIPLKDIENLKVLQTLVPDVIKDSTQEVRKNYVALTQSIEDIKSNILKHENVFEISNEITTLTNNYVSNYWDILRNVSDTTEIKTVKEQMLNDMKYLLQEFEYIDVYGGYQIIAELWENSLLNDLELIANSDFYTIGRSRDRNMVTKGQGDKKRQEQDGWVGTIIPNSLIEKHLFQNELNEIENDRTRILNLDEELTELVEAAKDEESFENSVLYDALKKDKDDEPTDSFVVKGIKDEIKNQTKDSEEYLLLKKVESLLAEKTETNRILKTKELELETLVEERILKLTDEEIDTLVYEKWFGNIIKDVISLSQRELLDELSILEELSNRYKDTLSSIDEDISTLEAQLELLMKDLVVVK